MEYVQVYDLLRYQWYSCGIYSNGFFTCALHREHIVDIALQTSYWKNLLMRPTWNN